MKRKFECKNCGKLFEADDSTMVVCPHCQSDNVDIARARIPVKVWIAVAGVIAVVFLTYLLFKNGGEEQENVNEVLIIDEPIIGGGDTIKVNAELVIPPTIEVGDLSLDGNGYTFKVGVKNPPAQKVFIAIFHPYDSLKQIARSEDGQFKGVPYSDADGAFYNIALVDAATDTVICSIPKTGFIKQVAVATKMTAAELQQKIESRDESLMGIGENDYLAPDYKLTFTGLPSDAVNIPTILSDVFEKLDMETWATVTVTNLWYDDKNRISSITLDVKLP
jgi:hypothetical protein